MSGKMGARSWHPSPLPSDDETEEHQFFKERTGINHQPKDRLYFIQYLRQKREIEKEGKVGMRGIAIDIQNRLERPLDADPCFWCDESMKCT